MRLHTWVLTAAIAVAPAIVAAQSGSGGGGTTGQTGTTGTSGQSGTTGTTGTSGQSGTSGSTGTSGQTGTTDPTGASGQTSTSGQTGTSGQTSTSGQTGTSGQTSTSGQTNGGMFGAGAGESHWIASGFVGSDFGSLANGSSVDFGGSVGYLWNNWVGGEFLAGFSPNFQLQSNAPNAFLLNGTNPAVNSYMVNAIGAAALGPDANWQPFISGGFGAITLRSGLNGSSSGTTVGTTVSNT